MFKNILTCLLLLGALSASAGRSAISTIPNSQKMIALTFDDGPSAYTAPILDILEKHQVKATFFQIGKKVKAEPQLSKLVTRKGHEIGNHSMTHPKLTELKTSEDIREEILGFQKLAKKTTGVGPTVFRAPFLKFDDRVWSILDELNLPAFNASVYADYKGKEDLNDPAVASAHADAVVAKVISGAIILMHEREITLNYLDEVVAKLKGAGFVFCTVSELQAAATQ
ncbi:polysaccharide deacetylase family protein [Pontiella sulfatireligans]|uniref:Bifunctional xylanase/deacetylase n=1 Tax=Pontiella sulfatireligans TaxID=2750658 RepID=A0A6C2UGE2_9BACT|nr:polysaccharide deacetylase family protein [Pontiella sulfatireligans]VGO19250.1 Bifunctional xylanase/deacetylase [Pontiella sulfatireligans]